MSVIEQTRVYAGLNTTDNHDTDKTTFPEYFLTPICDNAGTARSRRWLSCG
jgi:hypothetical protein